MLYSIYKPLLTIGKIPTVVPISTPPEPNFAMLRRWVRSDDTGVVFRGHSWSNQFMVETRTPPTPPDSYAVKSPCGLLDLLHFLQMWSLRFASVSLSLSGNIEQVGSFPRLSVLDYRVPEF